MEVSEFTKMVLDRIQIIEPENATKIIGYLLLKHSHQEILAYALGPEENIQSLINEAKSFLTSSSRMPIDPTPIQSHLIQAPQYFPPQTISRPFSLQSSFRVPALNLSPLYPYNDFTRIPQTQEHANALSSLGDLDYPGNCFYPPICFSEPTKPCHFYHRGHCKRGNSCKYLHDLTNAYESKKILTNDHELPSASLEQLEFEIIELLKESKRIPVSIASLPSMYSEKYGKNLQAEGYLTESQRHGKAGFSLTKLLARLNCVRIIDRPHGQHAVVLLEDIPNYEYRDERSDSGDLSRSAHQIYLTFAAESTFTNEDIANYFTQYGPVREVRIPLQEKRMFGFVSFLYSDTVKIILSLGNPHLICGSRVLVKPYKDKARNNERKYTERAELPMYNPPNYSEIKPEILSDWTLREFQNSNLRKQLLEEDDLALELESRRLLGLQLNPNPVMPYSYYNYGTDDLQTPIDYSSAMHIAASDDQHQQTENDFSDQDSNHVELPDNPFD